MAIITIQLSSPYFTFHLFNLTTNLLSFMQLFILSTSFISLLNMILILRELRFDLTDREKNSYTIRGIQENWPQTSSLWSFIDIQ